jgi:phosphoribosylformylglycinamidine (FGAM) synthase-like amidotransferase family enzyme
MTLEKKGYMVTGGFSRGDEVGMAAIHSPRSLRVTQTLLGSGSHGGGSTPLR